MQFLKLLLQKHKISKLNSYLLSILLDFITVCHAPLAAYFHRSRRSALSTVTQLWRVVSCRVVVLSRTRSTGQSGSRSLPEPRHAPATATHHSTSLRTARWLKSRGGLLLFHHERLPVLHMWRMTLQFPLLSPGPMVRRIWFLHAYFKT
jgi:hypothetical protein